MSKQTSNPNIEDFYPLSPLQQGILFHAVDSPESDVYCGQMLCQLQGLLNPEGFVLAWQQALANHPILRSRFVWQQLKEPVQVVLRQVDLPLSWQDWRGRSPSAQRQALEKLRQEDRRRGFDLSQPPLMRLTVMQMAETDYQLLWTYHHLLLDGWSTTILFQDVIQRYQAHQQGQTPQVPKPRPYRDYLVWLHRQDLAAAEQFWRRELAGLVTPTVLAIDTPTTSTTTTLEQRGKQQRYLSQETRDRLRQFAREHHLTLNTLLQGAWALLLARYSGQEDVLFGITSSGRPGELAGIDATVGVFINTLPLRVQVPAKQPLLSWLRELQVRQVEVRQYEYSPLGQVQRWSSLAPGQPLFDTLLLFQNYPIDEKLNQSIEGLTLGPVETFEQTHYGLTLSAIAGECLELRLLYDAQHYSHATVSRLLGHVETILGSLVSHPQQSLGDITWLTEGEQQQLQDWGHGPGCGEACGLCHDFETQVQRSPQRLAVSDGQTSLTYEQLNQQANQLAHWLQSQGVGEGTLVALALERSSQLLVALWGILKTGAAYVPLDVNYPQERLAFILQDSQPALVLTQSQVRSHLPQLSEIPVLDIDLDLDGDDWKHQTVDIAQPPSSPDALAYLIYTSGSTGQPKGVAIKQGSVVNFLRSLQAHLQLSQGDRLLAITTLSFDIAVLELFLPLMVGAQVQILGDRVTRDAQQLAQVLDDSEATVMQATPATWQMLLSAGWSGKKGLTLLCGGEALSRDLAAQLIGKGEALWNLYGPTETTIWSTIYRVQDIEETIPIGRPIHNTQVYVLDKQQQPVPIGVPGELYLGGAGLAREYWRRPELTQERFLELPWGRLYRTGDLVRYREDGMLEHLGRLDHQVKLRGYRIELGDIESHLRSHPQVNNAVVMAREDRPGDRRLVAYVASEAAHADLQAQLQHQLRRQLPHYMVPTAIVVLDTLPLTPNGKIDRRHLRAPELPPSSDTEANGTPQTTLEKNLAQIWSQVLGGIEPSRHDNFFELGGHSLLAAQTIARIRDQWPVNLPMSCLFDAPTIAELAAVIEAQWSSAKPASMAAIEPTPRGDGHHESQFPLSFSQRQLWILDRLNPNQAFYTLPAAVKLEGELNLTALQATIQTLVDRHEPLRSRIVTIDGQPRQVITPQLTVPLTVLEGQDECTLKDICQQEIRRPFDLSAGPLFRVTLLQRSPRDHWLLLTLHHIIADGWSMGVLIEELAQAYGAIAQEKDPDFAPLKIQYGDFAQWQQDTASEWLPQQLDYWRDQLQDAPWLLPLPLDRPRPPQQRFDGAKLPFQLTPELTAALVRLSHEESASLFMTLLAAFKALLWHWTGATDILVGSPIANRHQRKLEPLIGLFVNTLVLRSLVQPHLTFRQFLAQVRDRTLDAYAHPDVPFERLVEELRHPARGVSDSRYAPRQDPSYNPLFQVWFVLQNTPTPEVELPGLTLRPLPLESQTARHDLKLNLWETPQGLTGFWNYKTHLFDRSTIEGCSQRFVLLLERLSQNPDRPLEATLKDLAQVVEDRQQQVEVQQAQTLQQTSLQRLKQIRRNPHRG